MEYKFHFKEHEMTENNMVEQPINQVVKERKLQYNVRGTYCILCMKI